MPENLGEEIKMDFADLHCKPFGSSLSITVAVDGKSRWPVAKICKITTKPEQHSPRNSPTFEPIKSGKYCAFF